MTRLPFGRWLGARRKACDLTQAALAQRVGCSVIALQKIEAGARRPSLQMAERIAAALNLDPPTRAQFLAAARGVAPPLPLAAPPPPPLTPLLGRERDLGAIETALLRERARLLTLWGPAGVGKTRLAIAAAATLGDAFPDGVAFVDLAPLSDPALVADALARALGAAPADPAEIYEALAAHLHGRRLLLVLDNMEQLLDAGPGLAHLLGRCPGLAALVTSRALLRVRGERPQQVPPLELPASDAPDDLLRSPAGALFVAGARAAYPAFALTPSAAAAVAAICRKLDGVPLAIELVAARARLLAPEQIRARLDAAPLQVAAHGPADLPERQQALAAAIDWSHALLDAPERALFARLGVFRGGWDIEAAEAVCAEPGAVTLDLAASLLDKSLIRPAAPPGPTPRFTMLEMVRAYALERLAERGEEGRARRAHAAYYAGLAEAAEPALLGAEQVAWLERLAREHDNLRQALAWSLGSPPAPEGPRLAAALWRFWWMRGHLAEGRRWLERAAELLADDALPPDEALRARVLTGAGVLAEKHGDYARATRALEGCLAIRRALGDQVGAAATLNSLGVVARARGDRGRARELFGASLEIRRALMPERVAPLLSNLAAVLIEDGDYTEARALLAESLELARRQGDTLGVACALNILGTVALRQRDLGWAGAYLRQSVELFDQIGDQDGIAESLEGLAELALQLGDPLRVAALAGAAAGLREAIGAQPTPADRAAHLACVTAARSRARPGAWSSAWSRGQAASQSELVALALEPERESIAPLSPEGADQAARRR